MDKDLTAVIFLAASLLLMTSKEVYGSTGAGMAWQSYIDVAAAQNGVDPDLIRAIIMTESSGNPEAVRHDSKGDSIGLMQITMPAAHDVGYRGSEGGLMNPVTNIEVGTKYFRYLLDQLYGNILNAIAAYNAGVTNVKRGYITKKYVNRVMSYYYKIKSGKRYF